MEKPLSDGIRDATSFSFRLSKLYASLAGMGLAMLPDVATIRLAGPL